MRQVEKIENPVFIGEVENSKKEPKRIYTQSDTKRSQAVLSESSVLLEILDEVSQIRMLLEESKT